MNNLIERYVGDVIRRLPERDRVEVKNELLSNIFDMLEDDAAEPQIIDVLSSLGSPARLAEKYRQKPRYLISPAIFDEYISVLKLVLPIAGGIILAVGLALGCIEAMGSAEVSIGGVIGWMVSKGVQMAVGAVFQAAVVITVIFSILDKVREAEENWTINDLPELQPDKKYAISLADSIAELALTVVFYTVFIALCTGLVPVEYVLKTAGSQVTSVFAPGFIRACIPAFTLCAVFGVLECAAKIAVRRWNAIVCGAVVLQNIVSAGALIFLAARPVILSDELLAFIHSQQWINFGTAGRDISINVLAVFVGVVLLAMVAECVHAVVKTVKAEQQM